MTGCSWTKLAIATLLAVAWPGEHSAGAAPVIIDVRDQAMLSEAELVERLREADLVILGELHDHSEHHRLQARLVAALQPVAVVLEMVTLGQQPILDGHTGDTTGLGAQLRWSERGWPDFAHYRPILDAVLAGGAALIAGDLDRTTIRAIVEDGTAAAFDPAWRTRTGLAEPLPPLLEAALLEELARSHCGRIPAARLPRIAEVQRARDALLAERMVTASTAGLVVLIAGKGHARTDRGVPWYLQRLAPERSVASLGFLTRPPDPTAPFDLVWLTKSAGRTIAEVCAE
jgi:uncharacterized iron-regulated protein